jgi:hypothetical protein
MPTTASGGAKAGSGRAGQPAAAQEHPRAPAQAPGHDHELTVTIPLDRVTDMVVVPVMTIGRALNSRGGLPVYVGLGVMAVADVMSWPVAAATGLSYALLRRWRPYGLPPAMPPRGPAAAASSPPASTPG